MKDSSVTSFVTWLVDKLENNSLDGEAEIQIKLPYIIKL